MLLPIFGREGYCHEHCHAEIILNGSASVSIRLGDSYTDAGATATDNVDGDISDRIVVTNPVNTDRAGTYTITYRVEDLAGNAAVATRTVVVAAATTVKRSSGGGAVSLLFLAVLATLVIAQSASSSTNSTKTGVFRRER